MERLYDDEEAVEEDPGMEPQDLDEQDFKAEFMCARPGDHLLCPFQCDLCHFRNITKSDPIGSVLTDFRLMRSIRRASLDAFWARASSTVASNLQEIRRYVTSNEGYYGVVYSFEFNFPRGPFSVEDSWGMLGACALLRRSLDLGKNSETVQYATVRRQQAAISNYAHTTPRGMAWASLTADRNRQFFSASPTNSLFFSRFTLGCHNRMGDVILRDRALTIEELAGLLTLLEDHYRAAEADQALRFEVATLGCALVVGYSSAIRGEEFGHCLLKETVRETQRGLLHISHPHVMVALEGRFKGVLGRKKHWFPLVSESASGVLKNEVWLSRLLREYLLVHKVPLSGSLFRVRARDSRPATLSELDGLFRRYLKELQVSRPEILSSDSNVDQEFSFRRSLRRGSTTHARNRSIPKDVIEANNRWRKHEHSKNKEPSLSMLDTYTDVVAALQLLLRYSKAL
jgi:hypothetical protein